VTRLLGALPAYWGRDQHIGALLAYWGRDQPIDYIVEFVKFVSKEPVSEGINNMFIKIMEFMSYSTGTYNYNFYFFKLMINIILTLVIKLIQT